MDTLLEAKKFAWSFMLDGNLPSSDNSRSVFGRDTAPWVQDLRNKNKSFDEIREIFSLMVRTIGVDWDKTKEPREETEYDFAGTDQECDRVRAMHGILVLNNGEEFFFTTRYDLDFLSQARNLTAFLKRYYEFQKSAEFLFNDPHPEFVHCAVKDDLYIMFDSAEEVIHAVQLAAPTEKWEAKSVPRYQVLSAGPNSGFQHVDDRYLAQFQGDLVKIGEFNRNFG